MVGETKPGCTEFDALLAEAIDGTLSVEQRERFEQHRANCETCGAIFAEVTSGLAWLGEVEDVAPPQDLIRNILAATSGAAHQAAMAEPRLSVWQRLRRQLGTAFAPVLTPRFGMSMGMAFFSITLVLNMAQIRIRDLTPHNLSHTFYSSQNKLMKYYENMRLVYEIESRVRDLRNATEESEREREEKSRPREQNNNRTLEQNQNSEPDRRPHLEYSRSQQLQLLASLQTNEPYLGTIGTHRREI